MIPICFAFDEIAKTRVANCKNYSLGHLDGDVTSDLWACFEPTSGSSYCPNVTGCIVIARLPIKTSLFGYDSQATYMVCCLRPFFLISSG